MRHAYTPDPKMRHALLALCDLRNLLITFFIIILTFFIILTMYTAQSAGNMAALLLTFVRFDNGRHGPTDVMKLSHTHCVPPMVTTRETHNTQVHGNKYSDPAGCR